MESFVEFLNDTKFLAWYVWGSYAIILYLGLIGYLGYRPKQGSIKHTGVSLVIASIANEKVRNTLFQTIEHTQAMFSEYPIHLLVDEGASLISELPSNLLVVVPRTYRHDLIGKGRALSYFTENFARDDRWYSFIDDDNLILDDRFLYEIPYYESRGRVAMNPILIARKGHSNLCYVADHNRTLDDYLTYRFFVGLLARPWFGLHGELLTVKGSVLKEIGFARRSLTEDNSFAMELIRHGYKTWQSATKVSIRSPNDIVGFIKQRARWYSGIMRDVRYGSYPAKMVIVMRSSILIMGFVGSWMFLPLWFIWQNTPWFLLPLIPYFYGSILWACISTRNLKYIFLIPVYSIMEAISAWVGLFTTKFTVIDKS